MASSSSFTLLAYGSNKRARPESPEVANSTKSTKSTKTARVEAPNVPNVQIPPNEPPRESGKQLERDGVADLHKLTQGALTTGYADAFAKAHRGGTAYAWSDVPAWILRAIKYIPRDEAELMELLNAAVDKRGWSDSGADAIIQRSDIPGAFTLVQFKDVKMFANINLTTFFMLHSRMREYHTKTLGLPQDTPSALLMVANDTSISSATQKVLDELQRDGFYWKFLEDFEPIFERKKKAEPSKCAASSCDEAPMEVDEVEDEEVEDEVEDEVEEDEDEDEEDEEDDENDEEDEEMATVDAPTEPLLSDVTTGDVDSDARLVAPFVYGEGVEPRKFQTETAKTIVTTRGLHLVQAPPGVGKSAILAEVVGLLFSRPPDGAPDGYLGFFTAPHIDHARNLYDRFTGVLKGLFGETGWEKRCMFVACETERGKKCKRPSPKRLKAAVARGVRLFIGTDRAAKSLLQVAEAVAPTRPIVCGKDEAHASSRHEAPSTRLLTVAANSNGGVGGVAIAATATPDENVLALPGLRKTLTMSMTEAIEQKFCADYEIHLPLVTKLNEQTEGPLPVDVRRLTEGDALNSAALFNVQGMLEKGKRRCIAYAHDLKSAQVMERALTESGAALGADVWVKTITYKLDGRRRKQLYDEFQTTATRVTRCVVNEEGARVVQQRPRLCFLVAVRILDQCVDLAKTDAVLIAEPPNDVSDRYVGASLRRFVQRLGRALRRKVDGRTSVIYVFAEQGSPWIDKVFAAIEEGLFDRDFRARVRVCSFDPTRAHTEATKEREAKAVAATLERYAVWCKRAVAPSVSQKWQMFAKHFADQAPKCNKKTKITDETMLPDGLTSYTFDAYNFLMHHETDLRGDTDLARGLRARCTWLQKWLDDRAAKWTPSVDEKIDMFVRHFATSKPKRGKGGTITIKDRDLLPDGVDSYEFNAGQFWNSICVNCIEADQRGGRKPKTAIHESTKAEIVALPWFDAWKTEFLTPEPSVAQKMQMMVQKFPTTKPTSQETITIDNPALLPDGLASYEFNAGTFWNSICLNCIEEDQRGGRKPHVAIHEAAKAEIVALPWFDAWKTKFLTPVPSVAQKVQMMVQKFPTTKPSRYETITIDDPALLPAGLASYEFQPGTFWKDICLNCIEEDQRKGRKPGAAIHESAKAEIVALPWFDAWKTEFLTPEPSVAQKVQMMVQKFPTTKPTSQETITIDDPALLPDSLASYEFHAGQFWYHIYLNFVTDASSKTKNPHTTLTTEQQAAMRQGCKWIGADA